MDIQLEKFREWLEVNTNLLEGSIEVYDRTARRFFKEHDSLTIENINEFVSSSFRNNSSFYVKYTFKHILKYYGKEDMYKLIVPVKVKPRKRLGKFLPAHMINKLIEGIRGEKFKSMAILQYATGARAREVITIKEENIDLDFRKDAIRLRLLGKGAKERMTFLAVEFRPLLQKYMKGKAGFIFLPSHYDLEDPVELEQAINTQRAYLYIALKKSAKELGLDGFGTHDFRRNVAEQLRKKYKDPFLVKKVLGHSNINTTLRYFDETSEDLRKALIGRQED